MNDTNGKRLWTATVVSSKVIRVDPEVFRALQGIAIERGMQSASPAQVLKLLFEEQGLLRKGDPVGW